MSSTAHGLAPIAALLAIVPGVLFALDRSAPIIALSTVSVVLIAGCLHWMFSGETRPDGIAE